MVLEDLLHPMKVKVAQLDPPAMRETWVRSLGWEDPWRREQLPTRVFWPGEFHGLYSPWGHKESDTTERLSLSFTFHFSIQLCQLHSLGVLNFQSLSLTMWSQRHNTGIVLQRTGFETEDSPYYCPMQLWVSVSNFWTCLLMWKMGIMVAML